MRGGTSAFPRSNNPLFGCALGAVSCNFKRELKPYETYDMWTRVLSWDEKWIYIATHFVRKDAARPLRSSLYPNQEFGRSEGPHESTEGLVASALSKCVFKQGRKTIAPETMMRISGLLPAEEAQGPGMDSKSAQWTMERIEMERRRGMETAKVLANECQHALEREFFASTEGEALGRHSDGTGLAGVASTLCQLAKLKTTQLL